MSALAARSGLVKATSTNAGAEAALLALYDMVAQRLAKGTPGAGNATLAELKLARESLGFGAATDMATATTPDFTTLDGDMVIMTGNVASTGVTMNNGQTVYALVAGNWPLTYHASNMPIPGGASRACEPGDQVIFRKSRTGTLYIQIVRKDGQAMAHPAFVEPGIVVPFAGSSAPQGYLKANGAAVSRTTYAALFAAIVKTATASLTLGSPGTVGWTAHGRSAGDPVKFSTTGALLTGLSAGTTYYVLAAGLATDSFRVSATPGGTAINFTGTQSGTHTVIHAPFGDGNGSTTFNVPDLRGEFIRGLDDGRGVDANRVPGTAQAGQFPSHNHTISFILPSNPGQPVKTVLDMSSAPGTGLSTSAYTDYAGNATGGTDNSSENRPRNVALLYCIKY